MLAVAMSPSTLCILSTLISSGMATPLFNLTTRAVGFAATVPVDTAGILLAARASMQVLATFPHSAVMTRKCMDSVLDSARPCVPNRIGLLARNLLLPTFFRALPAKYSDSICATQV
ncbi:hypothetical protein C8R47DRAFT_1074063 [Mycena vitilis]|nr:hypothetical protein C8R47DRAFT_1074063 [Mycena vitilis]